MLPDYTGVSISLVYPIVKTIVMLGHDKDVFFRAAGIDESFLNNAEARVSGEEFERITEVAAAITADQSFGLHQGQHIEVTDLGIIGYVMTHSKTIGQALSAYEKFNVIVCSGYKVTLVEAGEDIVIEMSYRDPNRQPSRHCIEDITSSIYYLMIRLSCRTITLKEVHFIHELSTEMEEYRSVLGITPQFGKAANRIRMSKEIVEYPIIFADSRLLETFEDIAVKARDRLMQGRSFSDELYNWIIKCMPICFPSLKETALAFKMSVRSIQAKLKLEHTTFQNLINRVRRELAIGYLAKPEYRVGEVAYLLHFSEPSAFQSAFKKWTGVTPGQYRLDLLNAEPHSKQLV